MCLGEATPATNGDYEMKYNAYEITAKFNSTCPETGKQIKKGERCLYYPNLKKAYHMDSKTAENHRSQQFAAAWGMVDANY